MPKVRKRRKSFSKILGLNQFLFLVGSISDFGISEEVRITLEVE
jgi:hypothetical protein